MSTLPEQYSRELDDFELGPPPWEDLAAADWDHLFGSYADGYVEWVKRRYWWDPEDPSVLVDTSGFWDDPDDTRPTDERIPESRREP